MSLAVLFAGETLQVVVPPPGPTAIAGKSNLRVGYDNLYTAPTVVIASTSAVNGLPLRATQNSDRSYITRSVAGIGTYAVEIDCQIPRAAQWIVVSNVKTIGGGQVALYHRGDGATPGTPVFVATLGSQHPETKCAQAFFDLQAHRHWHLHWTNPQSVLDYAEFGHAFLGLFWEPELNILPEWTIQRVDPSIEVTSLGGQKSFAERPKYFAGEWRWGAMGSADFDRLRASIYGALGRSKPVVLSLDTTDAPWATWLARMSGSLPMTPSLARRRHGITMSWEEVR